MIIVGAPVCPSGTVLIADSMRLRNTHFDYDNAYEYEYEYVGNGVDLLSRKGEAMRSTVPYPHMG
jgi:hypothetical protein